MDTSKLSRAEMRVRIAKDVLKLMQPPKPNKKQNRPELVLTEGTYFELDVSADAKKDPDENGKYEDGSDVELQDLLKGRSCEVCGLGALFVAEVWRNDKMKVHLDPYAYSVEVDREDMVDRLKKFFTDTELDRIENWFEASEVNYTEKKIDGDIVSAAYELAASINGEDRLKLLLKFIVKNDGHLSWRDFLKEVTKE